MLLRRLAVLTLALAALAGSVPLSSALFSSRTTTTASVRSSVDWTPPVVALSDPGAYLRGTVFLNATASDVHTSVATIRFQLAPAGSSSWTTLCTTTTSPSGCSLATTLHADGLYDLRAVATDIEGNSSAAVVTGRRIDNTAPAVTVSNDPVVRGTVNVEITAIDAGSGVATVTLQRSLADANTWTTICTTSTAPYTCTWNTAGITSDDYDLRAIATDRAGNTQTSPISDVLVDNIVPTVTLIDPGSPLRGTVTLSSNPADTLSGVATVTYQYAPAGTTNWTTACVTSTSPFSCLWATVTVADASYDLRAIVSDVAGNTATSATIKNRVVDNTVSSVSVVDPGPYLSGTVTITANANSTAGIQSVRIQVAPSGTSSWTDLCTTTAAPYTCTWNTTLVADGLYDFRAILLDGANKTTTSAVVASRRVDNAAVRGVDVQTMNGGATVGRVEAGDTMVLTYSRAMAPTSFVAGWDGTPRAVVLRLRDGGLVGLSGQDDTLDVFTSSALTTPVRLGSVNLRGDYIKGGKTAVFNATLTESKNQFGDSVLTLTVGTQISGGGIRTTGGTPNAIWTPSALATDTNGAACSPAPVVETGVADKDF